MISIRRSSDVETIQDMDRICFPEDEPVDFSGNLLWLATDALGNPAAYASLKPWYPDSYGYCTRAGVLPAFRGQGLQLRLLRARTAFARREGLAGCFTYTMPWNTASMNNLIKAGFKTWVPGNLWGGPGAVYWEKVF